MVHVRYSVSTCAAVGATIEGLSKWRRYVRDLARTMRNARIRSANSRLCAHLGKAEIDELQIAILIQEQVFRLQVAVDDVQRMHVRKDRHHLCRIEARVRVEETPLCRKGKARSVRVRMHTAFRGLRHLIRSVRGSP